MHTSKNIFTITYKTHRLIVMNQKQISRFYRIAVFGEEKDDIKASSRRAYRDMCRTLCFKDNLTDDQKNKIYDSVVTEVIIPQISKCYTIGSAADFDTWHKNVCEVIRTRYKDICTEFYYGQAQKWINMTLKYLCILKNDKVLEGIYPFLHVPIDNIIINRALNEFGLKVPDSAWSRLDKSEYLEYQIKLINHIKTKTVCPLDWEFDAWNDGKNG